MNQKLLILFGFLFIFSSASNSQDAAQEIGIVLATQGEVNDKSPNGDLRTLKRRSVIFRGNVITLASNSKAQLRFSDGTLMTLAENTTFRVDDYKFQGTNEDSFVGSLVTGAVRALPGGIDRKNSEGLKISTPVAVMGVVGTHFKIASTDLGTYLGFIQGSGWLKNALTSLSLGDTSSFDFGIFEKALNAHPQGSVLEPPALLTLEAFFTSSANDVPAIVNILRESSAKPLTRSELQSLAGKIQRGGLFADRAIIKLGDRQAEIFAEGISCR